MLVHTPLGFAKEQRLAGDSVHVRTLRKAIEIAGSTDALAEMLGVTPSHIDAWLDARIRIPTYYFLELVDVVMNAAALDASPPPRASGSSATSLTDDAKDR